MTRHVEITWSAVLTPDSDAVMAKRETTLLPRWADVPGNACTVASTVLEMWLREPTDWGVADTRWAEWFGDDAAEGQAVVVIHGPAAVAGVFAVDLERTVKGYAEVMRDETVAQLRSLLASEPGVLE